ncbi:exo-alpha-sialidase [Actinotignum sp. SLA_B059]|uniref:exo-alpha-sialidase n=2 Tax=unclassified Actinotignum TaxID=2632702 RepID=UPI002A8098CC|nr:exo-alpha-sialidase [Actinotignum sp. SLA_B059]MDY5127887.1 exo-alpha-sialidase [Actinotignum sp. SLA_B059]
MSTPHPRRGWKAFAALSATVALTVTPLTAWASPGEESPAAKPAPTETLDTAKPPTPSQDQDSTKSSYMKITFERIDDGDEGSVRIGEELRFAVTYTNTSDQKITAFPYQSNLKGFLPPKAPNCRWGDLKPGETQGCSSITYTVTEDDAEEGAFTPYVVFRATKDRNGTEVLQDNIRAELPELVVLNEHIKDQPDPSTIPTDRKDMKTVRLAKKGDKPNHCYRIPALTQAKNGWILAAYDGRPGSCADSPNPNHITLRISKDKGRSWEAPKEILQGKGSIHDSDKYGYSDPSFVVNEETGRIFLFSVFSYDKRFQDSQPGTDSNDRNVLHAQFIYSDNHGETWSDPRIITKDITFDENIRSRFAASGAGIQLKYGPHKGRLIQQFTMTMPNGKGYAAVSVYSDDNGATWTPGQPVYGNMDENKVVELSDGTVMLNSRSSDGIMARKIAFSKDGGQTYTPMQVEWQLPDPRNNASIIRAFPNAPQGSAQAKILLYSSSSATSRSNGLVRISYDDGRTWSVGKQFKRGAMSYSTMWALQDGRYGIFYEGDNNDMLYAHFHLDWLNSLPVSAVPADNAKVYRGKSTIPLSITNTGGEALGNLVATPTELPSGWSAEAVTVENLKAGETRIVQVPVTIDKMALSNKQPYKIPFRLTSGDKVAVNGFAEATLADRVCESKPELVDGISLANALPEETRQENNGAANLLDGNLDTIWHTPWSKRIKLPLDVDLNLPKAENIGRVDVYPRMAGGNNGRIRSAELWAGKDAASAVKVAEGNFKDSTDPATFLFDAKDTKFLRLHITGTYGNVRNTLASAAEIKVYRMTEVKDGCVEPTPDPTPDPSPDPAPKPNPSPDPSPAPSPEPTPGTDPTPGTPDPSPTPSPEPTPDPSKPAVPESHGNANYLSNSWTSTVADLVFSYGRSGDEVLVGDWDGDGKETLAVRRGNQFFVKNTLGGGNADTVFSYGKAGDKVVVGDWDGDGKDTFAVIRGNKVFVKNSLTSGNADTVFSYGKTGDKLIVGDWNGDGKDTFAAVRGNRFFIKNSLAGGNADATFSFGRVGDEVIVGDWDGDGVDTVGVRRGNVIHTADANGNTTGSLAYGRTSDQLLIGDWDGDGIDTPGVRR